MGTYELKPTLWFLGLYHNPVLKTWSSSATLKVSGSVRIILKNILGRFSKIDPTITFPRSQLFKTSPQAIE